MKKLLCWFLLLCLVLGACSCETKGVEDAIAPAGAEYVADTAQKTSYVAGEIFDCTGAKIKVVYDNATEAVKNVTTEMVSNQPLAAGTQQVMVTYVESGKAVVCYIPITVEQPTSDPPKITLLSAEYVANSAVKASYFAGEVFDCTGAKIKVVYDNATESVKDVTAEMVSDQLLVADTQSVQVTYSEGGVTVVTYIPVTVVDPNATHKEAAIAKLLSNEKVVANRTDAGVALLVDEYSRRIEAAENVGEIMALVGNFEADLDAHLVAKEAVLAKFNDAALIAKINELYAQFKADIETAKLQAIANIKAASTIEEAEGYLAAFKVAVDNKLDEQKYYDKDDDGSGQIYDKIDLLEQLDEYDLQVDYLENTAYDAFNGADDEYQEIMDACAAVRSDISYLRKYVTLAVELDGIKERIETEIEPQIVAIRAMLSGEM